MAEDIAYELPTKEENQITMAVVEGGDSGNVLSPQEWAELHDVAKIGFTKHDQRDMQRMGKKQEFRVRWPVDYHSHQLTTNREISS